MSFLNPILLFGLAAVAVPIIIHLLNRRRFQKVVWAAMRFLQASVEQNQRRMRLEDLLLLALRCLLLLLLALALARPALLSKAADVFGQSKVTAVLILDHSYSMGMSDGTRTRFDKARQAAEAALDALPAGSAAAVFLASDVVRAAIPEPTFDLNLARKILREAPLSDRATDLLPALDRAVDLLKGRSLALRREIFLITDGQAAGWRQLEEIQRVLEQSRAAIHTHVLLVNEHEERNLGVSGLRLASGLAPARQPLRFEVRLSNFGREAQRDVRVSLSVNSEPPCDETTLDTLEPGATRSVSLFGRLPGVGYHTVTARLPEDRLRADDHRSVAVRALREVRVLLVDGEPGAEPRESEVFFLRHALAPVAPEAAADYFVKVASVPDAELPQARFDDFDAVVLANVPDFPESALQSIAQYLRRGGGLVVFPGGGVNVSFYNEHLLQRLALLPAALGEIRGQADQDERFVTFQEKDYIHPIVSLWNDPAAGTLASARFFRWFELRPAPLSGKAARAGPDAPQGASLALQGGEGTAGVAGGPSPDARSLSPGQPRPAAARDAGEPEIILKYSDGTPAVMERAWGLGRVVLFSSTADTAWNDLAVRPAFVPLVHRTLGTVVQRQDEGLNVRVGGRFARRVPIEFLGKDAAFFKPRQTDAVRDLRRVELVSDWPTLQYDQTDLAGVYDVTVADPPLNLKFAAQADPLESSLDTLSDAQLKTLRDVAHVLPWTPDLSLKSLVEKQRSGVELWLPLALLALLVAGAETVLGQWFSRSK